MNEGYSFKKPHIIKGIYSNGAPYKQSSHLTYIKGHDEFILMVERTVQCEDQPDDWHSFLREYKGKKYWSSAWAIRTHKFLDLHTYVIEKLYEIDELITKINR